MKKKIEESGKLERPEENQKRLNGWGKKENKGRKKENKGRGGEI